MNNKSLNINQISTDKQPPQPNYYPNPPNETLLTSSQSALTNNGNIYSQPNFLNNLNQNISQNFSQTFQPNQTNETTFTTQNSLYNNSNLISSNNNTVKGIEFYDEFNRLAKSILSTNPRITLKLFSKGYNMMAHTKMNFQAMTEQELKEIFENMPGVVLQRNKVNNSYNVLDLNIVCYSYLKNRKCECGLDCDGNTGELALGWRTMQCAEELFGGCKSKANCNYLHTKTFYK